MKKENKSDLNINQSVNKQSNNIRLSRRQLVKKRKLDKLVSDSQDFHLSFSIDLENLMSYLSDKDIDDEHDFEESFFEDISVNIRYKNQSVENCKSIFSIMSNNVFDDEENNHLFHMTNAISKRGKKQNSKMVKKKIISIQNYVLGIDDSDSSYSYASIKNSRLKLVFLKKPEIDSYRYRFVQFLIDKEVFKLKLINLLKDIVSYIKKKINDLVEENIISEENARRKYFIVCHTIYYWLYERNQHVFCEEDYERLKKRNSLLATYLGYLEKDLDHNMCINNSIYSIYYGFVIMIGKYRNRFNRKVPKGAGYSVVYNKMSPNYLKVVKRENFLKGIFELEDLKDENGNIRKRYVREDVNEFVKHVNKGLL